MPLRLKRVRHQGARIAGASNRYQHAYNVWTSLFARICVDLEEHSRRHLELPRGLGNISSSKHSRIFSSQAREEKKEFIAATSLNAIYLSGFSVVDTMACWRVHDGRQRDP